MHNFLNSDVVDVENYKFSYSGIFHTVESDKMEDVLAYINQLPDTDPPEIFGMNENADVAV